MGQHPLGRIRQIAAGLPEVTERLSHGAPCFFVRGRTPICRFHDSGFAGDDRVSLWCPAGPDLRDELLTTEPERFFAPTPSASGVFGDWIGVYLDTVDGAAVDWSEIAALLQEAYRLRAPKALVARLDQPDRPG